MIKNFARIAAISILCVGSCPFTLHQAMAQDCVSSDNTFCGQFAGHDSSGNLNAAVGFDALGRNNGSENVGVGFQAGHHNLLNPIDNGSRNTSVGSQSGVGVSGNENIALGYKAGTGVGNNGTISIGRNSLASGADGIAVGSNATATKTNSTALGNGATAGNKNSTAIGAGATTTENNQIMLGTGDTKFYTLAGLPAIGATAGNRLVTHDAAGNVQSSSVTITGANGDGIAAKNIEAKNIEAKNIEAKNIAAKNIEAKNTQTNNLTVVKSVTVVNGASINMGDNRVMNVAAPIAGTDAANKNYVDGVAAGLTGRINDAFEKIDENTEGIAVAIAMGGIAIPNGKTFAIGANMGFYEDKQAVAAQAALRISDTLTLNSGVGVGFDSNKVGGRIGFMAAW